MPIKTKRSHFLKQLFNLRPSVRQHNRDAREILKAWGNPQEKFPMVHVGGTNGKGQVAAQIAKALEEGGHRVGLFISPHIIDYEERITINGVKIPLDRLLTFDAEIRYIVEGEGLNPNFFDCTFCFALRYFAEAEVDVAVIEVGLGGLGDATNIIEPILSVVTTIGYDHMEYLGKTLDEIAVQKAGIIKPKTPVVLGTSAQRQVVIDKALKVEAPIIPVDSSSDLADEVNRKVGSAALEFLKERFSLSEEAIQEGLDSRLPCRFDLRGNALLDSAHNPDGFRSLAATLRANFPQNRYYFVIGMGTEKDHMGCLAEIKHLAKHIFFVEALKDGKSAHQLASLLDDSFGASSTRCSTIEEGVLKAKAATGADEIFVVCGSFYIMADALKTLGEPYARPKPKDSTLLPEHSATVHS